MHMCVSARPCLMWPAQSSQESTRRACFPPACCAGAAGFCTQAAGAVRGVSQQAGPAVQVYTVEDSSLCLTGTAEVPLGALYMDQTLAEARLPIRLAGFGHCFRTEAGAAGKRHCQLSLSLAASPPCTACCQPHAAHRWECYGGCHLSAVLLAMHGWMHDKPILAQLQRGVAAMQGRPAKACTGCTSSPRWRCSC